MSVRRVVGWITALFGRRRPTPERGPTDLMAEALAAHGNPTRAFARLWADASPRPNVVLASCALWSRLSPDDPHADPMVLHKLLEQLPPDRQAAALLLATDQDYQRAAGILTRFAPSVLPGLVPVARAIVQEWQAEPRSDVVALAFYRVLDAYGCAREHQQWLLARALVLRQEYTEAGHLLHALAREHPSAEILWLLHLVLYRLDELPAVRAEVLREFIRHGGEAGDGPRVARAWRLLGDLYGDQLDDGPAAVNAYMQAEKLGEQVPQLAAYRVGEWDAIPALRSHPDYPFPPVVAIDLEVDPLPGATAGSRVFEVGAVRTKGHTDLADFHRYVRRDFQPAKLPPGTSLRDAPSADQVAADLRAFIGDALVVGHNLVGFDAKHLAGMQVPIPTERMLDTLRLGQMLYPDSGHHALADLCRTLGIKGDAEAWHHALPDAQACARLLMALGDEVVRRGGALLLGFRALVQPSSALDRALLRPRQLAADPALTWTLDPTPSGPHVIIPTAFSDLPPSPGMLQALNAGEDTLVELTDPNGAYLTHLPAEQRALITVDSRERIERMLAANCERTRVYVLPHTRALLCPDRMRARIAAADSGRRLELFCLYQASHNHDARTLYPMRLPSTDPDIASLRQDLLLATRGGECADKERCPAVQAVQAAQAIARVLLATHEALVQYDHPPEADLIVVDDADTLTMRLAELTATRVDSEELAAALGRPAERDALHELERGLLARAAKYHPYPTAHERVPLRGIATVLTEPPTPGVNHRW